MVQRRLVFWNSVVVEQVLLSNPAEVAAGLALGVVPLGSTHHGPKHVVVGLDRALERHQAGAGIHGFPKHAEGCHTAIALDQLRTVVDIDQPRYKHTMYCSRVEAHRLCVFSLIDQDPQPTL